MRLSSAAFFLALLIAVPAMASTPRAKDVAPTADSLLAKSRAAEQTGNAEAALRYAQAAIVADPTRASTYTALGDLYMRTHDADSAGFYYAEALEIDPQDQAAQKGLSDADQRTNTSTAAASGSLDKTQNGQ